MALKAAGNQKSPEIIPEKRNSAPAAVVPSLRLNTEFT